MSSLHYQFIEELRVRVEALVPAWGTGGVQCDDNYRVEREMRPACRIADASVIFLRAKSTCEWDQASRFKIVILANTRLDRDARWVAICKALKGGPDTPWATANVHTVRITEVVFAQESVDAACYIATLHGEVQCLPVVAYAPDSKK